MTYEEFKIEYKKRHTCGIPYIPYELAYASDCPRCNPNSNQWKTECKHYWELGKTKWGGVQGWIKE